MRIRTTVLPAFFAIALPGPTVAIRQAGPAWQSQALRTRVDGFLASIRVA